MKHRKFLQLSLQGSLILFFFSDIQQDTLPIKWITLYITNEACIFFYPDNPPVTPDESIFFDKTRTALCASPVAFSDPLTILRVDGIHPQIWTRVPFFQAITCQPLNTRAHV